MARRTRITPMDRLRLMFSPGNTEATTAGNGSGTPGVFGAWKRKWIEPVGPFAKPTRWRITDAGREALCNHREDLTP